MIAINTQISETGSTDFTHFICTSFYTKGFNMVTFSLMQSMALPLSMYQVKSAVSLPSADPWISGAQGW